MVVPKVPKKYRRLKREALESWLVGNVTILNDVEVTNERTHLSEFKRVPVLVNEPCRIDNQTTEVTTDNEPAELRKTINVRLKPEIEVKVGSTFLITQFGYEREYVQSGEARHYVDHQIIPLIVKELA